MYFVAGTGLLQFLHISV